jgi:hypothetical protein
MSKYTTLTKGGAMAAHGHKTRRATLRALVGASVLAVPTIGAIAGFLPDPILAAIERHKAAYQALNATRFALDEVIYNPEGREVSQSEWDALHQAHENEDAAFDALLTSPPETCLGMRATIAHLISIDDGRLSQEIRQLLRLLLDSLLAAEVNR